jgi:hypothetical protein
LLPPVIKTCFWVSCKSIGFPWCGDALIANYTAFAR